MQTRARQRSALNRSIGLVAALALMAVATPALADDAICIQAYESTQTLRKAAKLLDARIAAAKCADPTCPSVLVKDCAKWEGELDASLPTIVLDVRGADGQPLTNVKVTANGRPFVDKIDPAPIQVDSGTLALHFESADAKTKPVDQTVTLKDGEKAHKISVTFGAAPVPQASAPLPLGPLVFGGAGVVAIGVGVVFAITGHSAENDLDKCKGHCTASDVNSVSTKYAVSDILFTAGVVSLVAAAYMFITRPSEQAASTVGSSLRRRGFVLEF